MTAEQRDGVYITDSFVSTGVPTFFRVETTNGAQDPELQLHDSDPVSSTSWVQGRSQAVATSTLGGPGASEQLSITPATGDTYGLVLTNEAGSGSYNVYRDTTAATGTVSIDGGAVVTRDTSVTLTLSATDAQTGIDAMRVSVDGVLDTEPFEAFAASKPVTLPSGDGTKTVLAQYRNEAFMVSPAVSDTIVLDTRPDIAGISVTNPPATGQRGTQFSVTDTVQNIGPTTAGASTTRYYFSADAVFGQGDKRVNGTRAVPSLSAGASSAGVANLAIPSEIKKGVYRLLACGDDLAAVDEFDEGNNCVASAGSISVQVPNLVVTSVSDPPDTGTSGTVFSVTDTTANTGNLLAAATTTRYYLSLNATFGAGDIFLTGSRSVPALAGGANSTGAVDVTVPVATPAGTYFVLACSDDLKVVDENKEGDKCRASADTVIIS